MRSLPHAIAQVGSLVPLALLLALTPSLSRAELAEGCTALGDAMVEHSCFHTTFGPFVSVPGTPGNTAKADTPNVDPVHTEYRVGLPVAGEVHVITYMPERAGNWVVFTGSDIPLEVLDEDGNVEPVVFEQRQDTGCDALPIARVYEFSSGDRHTLRLGPADVTAEMVVIEYADDFLVRAGRDEDGDGFGSSVDAFITNCTPKTGFAPNTSDCNDQDPAINPLAIERCDDVDENCNGSPDDVGLQCRTGAGACQTVGKFTCDGEVAVCDAEVLDPESESCNGKDDDCDSTIDNGGDALCGEDEKPRCVRRELVAFCGCLLDVDCGGLDSGRVCDLETNTCQNGCSTVEGGNGCPEGETCESEGGVTRGVCVPDEPEERPDNQVRQQGIDSGGGEDEGCQCDLGTSREPRWGLFGLMGGFALARLQRRVVRRPHPESNGGTSS